MATAEQKAEIFALLEDKLKVTGQLSEKEQRIYSGLVKEFPVTEKSPFKGVLDEAGARFNLAAVKPIKGAQKKLLEKRFGAENVMEKDGAFFARSEGSDEFFAIDPAPEFEEREGMVEGGIGALKDAFLQNPDFLAEIVETIPAALRGGLTLAGGIGGGLAGAQVGRPVVGSALGSTAGTAAGEAISGAVAGVQGLIESEDIGDQLATSGIKAGATGVGDLLFGGTLKAIANNPAAKAIATKAMKAAGKSADEIGQALKKVKEQYIDKSWAKQMERFKVGGDVALNKIKTQEMQALKKIEGKLGEYVPGFGKSAKAATSLGKQAQKAVQAELDEISRAANNRFKSADAVLLGKARQGKLVPEADFADASIFVEQFNKEINNFANDATIRNSPEASKLLSRLKQGFEESLNDTVRNAPRDTQAQLGLLEFIASPTKRDPLGMLVQEPVIKKNVEYKFNPIMVTGRDLRIAKNFIKDQLDTIGKDPTIPTGKLKTMLARAKGQIDEALSPGVDLQQTLGGVLSGVDDEIVEAGVKYQPGMIKVPNSDTFARYDEGYKILADGYNRVPNKVREGVLYQKAADGSSVKTAANPSSAQKAILNFDYEDSQKLGRLAKKHLKGRDRVEYTRAVEGQALQKGVRNENLPDVSPTPESIEQSQFISPESLKKAQMEGFSIKRDPVVKSQANPLDLTSGDLIPNIAAGSAETQSNKTLSLQGLFSELPESKLSGDLSKIGLLQQQRGAKGNIQEITSGLSEGKNVARSIGGLLGGAKGSFSVGAALSAVEPILRPLAKAASPVASALEDIPGGLVTQLAGEGLLGDDIGDPTEEQRKLYRLRAEKTRLLD